MSDDIGKILMIVYEAAVLLKGAMAGKEESAKVAELRKAIDALHKSFEEQDKLARERLG